MSSGAGGAFPQSMPIGAALPPRGRIPERFRRQPACWHSATREAGHEDACAGGGDRRRDRRLQRALSPDAARLARCRAGRAGRADRRLDLACRRQLPELLDLLEHHEAAGLQQPAVPGAAGGGRRRDRPPGVRQHPPRPYRGPDGGVPPRRGDGGGAGPGLRDPGAGRDAGAPPLPRDARRPWRAVGPGRRRHRSLPGHPGARQGCPRRRRCDLPPQSGRGRSSAPRPANGGSRPGTARSPARSWSTPPATGRARSAAWSGSTCRSCRCSTSTW